MMWCGVLLLLDIYLKVVVVVATAYMWKTHISIISRRRLVAVIICEKELVIDKYEQRYVFSGESFYGVSNEVIVEDAPLE